MRVRGFLSEYVCKGYQHKLANFVINCVLAPFHADIEMKYA